MGPLSLLQWSLSMGPLSLLQWSLSTRDKLGMGPLSLLQRSLSTIKGQVLATSKKAKSDPFLFFFQVLHMRSIAFRFLEVARTL